MGNIDQSRRKWLSLGGIILGSSFVANSALAALSTAAPKILHFKNINTGEKLSSPFSPNKGLAKSELRKLNYLMRDRRSNLVHNMDPNLFMKFYQIQSRLGLRSCEISVICGYRAPATNAAMHRRIKGVASNSYHMRGQAIDFRIDNVALNRVREVAQSLKNGGVGYYPRSNFVHVDTGPVRTWRGS